jgi:cobalt-zinc-cadmium efflux system outer membrane protein
MDMSRKRQSRTVVARMAKSTLEAQFQDVTRRQIDNLYRAFVNLQAARIDRLAALATVQRQEQRLADLRQRDDRTDQRAADAIDHLAFMLERSRVALDEATEAYDDARDGLGVLLNLSLDETTRLEPQGSLRTRVPEPPGLDELEAIALRCRPDLHAGRLGVNRAGAEVSLQRANRFDDVYLFYDPLIYQDNRPIRAASSHSWAVGLTFALPIYNRNQGNIARATSNVQQTRNELSSLERRVVSEVRLAEREFQSSKRALDQIERTMLPMTQESLRRQAREFAAGSLDADDYQTRLDEAAELVSAHRDAIVRHRRAMLDLNTAVGMRIMP